jgi:8-oxo-dGTP pyrophosphatase MutT (NUDIX family)
VIKRVVVDGDRHSGQISFPGGRRENGEPLQQTAIRESHEEVGTPVDSVQILGRLSELHIPVSNYIVHPYIGLIEKPYEYRRQASEVDAIHEVRIADLLDPTNRRRKDIRVPEGFLLKDVPYFDLAGEVVWGATAMIMSEFAAVVESVSVPGSH